MANKFNASLIHFLFFSQTQGKTRSCQRESNNFIFEMPLLEASSLFLSLTFSLRQVFEAGRTSVSVLLGPTWNLRHPMFIFSYRSAFIQIFFLENFYSMSPKQNSLNYSLRPKLRMKHFANKVLNREEFTNVEVELKLGNCKISHAF